MRLWIATFLVLSSVGISAADEEKVRLTKGKWDLRLSGLLEMEATYAGETGRTDPDDYSADIVCATIQFDLKLLFAEHLEAKIVLLWEEDLTEPMDIDEGWLRLNAGKFFFGGGRRYLNFGVFETNFISDPFTMLLSESQESAFFCGYETELFTIEAVVFNGDVEERGEASDRLMGYNLGLEVKKGILSVHFGWVSELADSDWVLADVGEVENHIDAFCISLKITPKNLCFLLEAVTALARYSSTELDLNSDGEGDKPLGWGAEIQIKVGKLKGFGEITIAFRIEGTKEAPLPILRYGSTLLVEFLDGASIRFETLFWENDEAVSGGLRNGYGFGLQFSYEF